MNYDKNEPYLIFRLIVMCLWISIIYPTIITIISNLVLVYLPCKLIFRNNELNVFVTLFIEFIICLATFGVASNTFHIAFTRLRQFTGSVYMESMPKFKNVYKDYFKVLTWICKISDYILNNDKLPYLIGMFIDALLIFNITHPFPITWRTLWQ